MEMKDRVVLIAFITISSNLLVHSLNFKAIMGQTISSTQFFLYGKKHFTRTGYLRHIKTYTDPVQCAAAIGIGKEGSDGVDLTGKVILVTGANSGIGKEVATYVAAKGGKLYMLCRNKERAETAKQEIEQATSSQNVNVILADVAELHQVRRAVQELQAKESSVHAIVCNAGVLLNERMESSEGNEITYATHLLGGSYLLSQLLLPQLRAAGDQTRVVFVTSGGMYNFGLPDFKVLTSSAEDVPYNGVNCYAFAKRAQVLLAERLTQDIPEVTWMTVHPGWVDTAAVEDAFGEKKQYLAPLRSTWEGAEGLTWMLGADAKKLESGSLYLDRETQPKHIAGFFFSEGTYTKNKPKDVDEMMENLKKAAEL